MKKELSKCCNTELIKSDGKIYYRHCGEEVKKMCNITLPHDFPDFPCKICSPKEYKMKKVILNDKGVPSKNQKDMESFVTYCLKYPEQRFWQALRNWSKVGYIEISNDREEWTDTFYLE